MKKIQINNRMSRMGLSHLSEEYIKSDLARQLGQQLANTFFRDLQLRRNLTDAINAIDYSYNLITFEPREYNDILCRIDNLIEYAQYTHADTQLFHLLINLKNIVISETTG